MEDKRKMPIFAASEMANPVFSVWSKTGPTLLRFLKGCLGNSLFVIQFRECCNEISSYLCSVKMNVLAIQVSFLRGQAASFGCGFAIFEKIRKKQSLAERERHGEGENVACEKRTSLAKGEKVACKQGERYWETGRKVLSGSFPSPALTN